MYIYELPFDVHKELCRLLDKDDVWKELAGEYMQYTPFDITEMEQKAQLYRNSPTQQLFTSWGQLNHKAEELFVLLYRMKHVPAMRCMVDIIDTRFHRLLHKLEAVNGNRNADNNNANEMQSPTNQAPILIQRNGAMDNFVQDLNNELNKVSAIPFINFKELQMATNNWNDDNQLGKGGFGTVYKGEWKHLPVAVKKLKKDEQGRFKELIKELCVNEYRHDNILPLYGYSIEGSEACLVYQLMACGSLEQRLRRSTHAPLTWPQRYWIAHGVARGLQFLHNMKGSPLIHGDVKPANILLDQCLMPKIGDFGLARKLSIPEDRSDVQVSRVCGTYAYLPADYIRSHVISAAVDVFSFGVVCLELATGLPAYDGERKPKYLTVLVRALHAQNLHFYTIEDPLLRKTTESNSNLCAHFIAIGLHCTQTNARERPSMLEVYQQLDALKYNNTVNESKNLISL